MCECSREDAVYVKYIPESHQNAGDTHYVDYECLCLHGKQVVSGRASVPTDQVWKLIQENGGPFLLPGVKIAS